ncbi:hypothetical protein DJ73_13780 [Halorubrum sp. Ea1]|nr:hypothetical protein DJ75_09815 [Halorubrum sp. Eb13]OYR44641.1 hypothetical protein DJ74_17395 [Halorubrum sp. Ea8]OYR45968.1 hypothetical protein DJ81_03980 [Halorubrum sp. Hd13]OYR51347.1 hypothetical protein DJ73_13780 [Halorubrum sp. Ea1]
MSQALRISTETDQRDLLHTVGIVDEARVLALIDLVEDDDGSRAVVPLEWRVLAQTWYQNDI